MILLLTVILSVGATAMLRSNPDAMRQIATSAQHMASNTRNDTGAAKDTKTKDTKEGIGALLLWGGATAICALALFAVLGHIHAKFGLKDENP